MHWVARIILSLLFFSTAIELNAQADNKYIFRHIDQSNGLLHNWVFSIAQDGRGFIWILSRNGLQRYDGSRFVDYPYDVKSSGGTAYSSDCEIFADKKTNRLWITHQGIEMLDLQKNEFTFFNKEQIIKDPFFQFQTYTDSLNHSWLAGNFGVFPGDSFAKKVTPYYITAADLNPGRSSLFFVDAGNGEAWFIRWGKGIFLFDRKTKRIYTHSYNPIHHPLLELMNKKELFFVFADSHHNLWISSIGPEFYQYNYASKKLITYSLYDIDPANGKSRNRGYTLTVNCFFEDDHHVIWAGTQNAGLLKYNAVTDRFTSITAEKENKNSIQYNYNITSIFQDKEKNIWLATDKGISLFNPYRQFFQSVHHDENDPQSLPASEIQATIETANGDILAGTWGEGITVFDGQWHFKKNISFNAGPEEYNLIWSFVQNDDGTIWAGCQHGYIHIYDPVNGSLHTIHPPEMHNITIRCMAKDKNGNILMGLHDGRIAKWDKNQNKFYSYNDDLPGIKQDLAPVFDIFIDEQQRCWVATEFGLKQFDADRMIYSASYTAKKNDPHAISANAILSVEGLNDSTLVIGTLYGGLNFFNKRSKTFIQLTISTGSPSVTINSIKKDAGDNIWFTTDYGLFKYAPVKKEFTGYNIPPSGINSSFKPGNFYCLKDGRWLSNTATEIIAFDPGGLQKQEAADLAVDITGFKISGKDIFIDSLLYAKKPVRLSYHQNFFSIEYGALTFAGLQETKYYYQLTGIDKDWVYAGSRRFANYTNLEPGDYTFRVKAMNEAGNEKITSFQIIITPPFWKTTWFRVVALMAAIALVYVLFRKRVKAVRHESEMKQKIAETEMMALRAQMNPHFIFNCINSIDAMIQSNDKYHATVYLNKFARLIRNILDSSKQNLVTLGKDMETLKLYVELEQFRNRNKFTSEIKVDEELLQDDYKVPPLIIQPYVENAILHGLRNRLEGGGKLFIGVEKQNGCIRFIVRDNGAGRKRSEPVQGKSSYGMQIGGDRIRNFNNENKASVIVKDLRENEQPAGTEIEVLIKIK